MNQATMGNQTAERGVIPMVLSAQVFRISSKNHKMSKSAAQKNAEVPLSTQNIRVLGCTQTLGHIGCKQLVVSQLFNIRVGQAVQKRNPGRP